MVNGDLLELGASVPAIPRRRGGIVVSMAERPVHPASNSFDAVTATLASTFWLQCPLNAVEGDRLAQGGDQRRVVEDRAVGESAPRVRLIAARYLLLPPNHALAEVSLIR